MKMIDPRETISRCWRCGEVDHHCIDDTCPSCREYLNSIELKQHYTVGEAHPACMRSHKVQL